MKASELIAALQEKIAMFGDCDVMGTRSESKPFFDEELGEFDYSDDKNPFDIESIAVKQSKDKPRKFVLWS